MRQRLNLADERQTSSCAYCRGELGTKDHVPSKVFIDKPYPENLPVVYCCAKCNQGFSLDEEYVACLIECLKSNSFDLNNFERNSIKKSLQYNDSLLTRIIESSEVIEGVLKIKIEEERLLNVLIKLIKGHLLYEFNLPIIEEKINISYFNLNDLNDEERTVFESLIPIKNIPEIGCRACCVNSDNKIKIS